MAISKTFIALTLGILVLTALEISLSLPFWIESGCEFSEFLQKGTNGFQDVFNWIVQDFTYFFIGVGIFCIMYAKNFVVGVEIIVAFNVILVVTVFFKTSIGFPRPCWYSDSVDCSSCSKSFGDPSGHSLVPACIVPYIIYRLKGNYLWHVFCGIGLGLIMYYRVYGGYHTYSQVLIGTLIGLYLLYLLIHCTESFSSYISSHKPLNASGFFLTTTLVLFSVIFVAILYLTRNVYWEDEWSENMEDDCEKIFPDDILLHELYKVCEIFFTLGVLTGYYFLHTQAWVETPAKWWESLIKILIALGIFEGMYILTLFEFENIPGTMVYKSLIFSLQGFFCTFLIPWACSIISRNEKTLID